MNSSSRFVYTDAFALLTAFFVVFKFLDTWQSYVLIWKLLTRHVSVLSLDRYFWRSSYEVDFDKFRQRFRGYRSGVSWSMCGHFLTVRSFFDWLIYLLRQFCRLCRRLSIDELVNVWRIDYGDVSLTILTAGTICLVLLEFFSVMIGIDDNIDIKFDAHDSRDWWCQITLTNWKWSISVISQSFTLLYKKILHILRNLLFSQLSECMESDSSSLWRGNRVGQQIAVYSRVTLDEMRLLLLNERWYVTFLLEKDCWRTDLLIFFVLYVVDVIVRFQCFGLE